MHVGCVKKIVKIALWGKICINLLTYMPILFIFISKNILPEGFMETLEITSLSTKGQVVIPRNIRNRLNLDTGDKLIVICDGVNILLKPVLMPSMSEFQNLVEETDKIANELETTPEKLNAFIKENR